MSIILWSQCNDMLLIALIAALHAELFLHQFSRQRQVQLYINQYGYFDYSCKTHVASKSTTKTLSLPHTRATG